MLTKEQAREAIAKLAKMKLVFDDGGRYRNIVDLLEYAIEFPSPSPDVIEIDVAIAARHDCIKYALKAYKLADMSGQHSDAVAMLVIKVAKEFEEYILATDK